MQGSITLVVGSDPENYRLATEGSFIVPSWEAGLRQIARFLGDTPGVEEVTVEEEGPDRWWGRYTPTGSLRVEFSYPRLSPEKGFERIERQLQAKIDQIEYDHQAYILHGSAPGDDWSNLEFTKAEVY